MPAIFGSFNHSFYFRIGVDYRQLNIWMLLREHPKNLIGEGLSYRCYISKVEHDNFEEFYTREQALCL